MRTYATPEEFFKAYCGMPANQRLALDLYARQCADGTRYSDGMDLLHDALKRVMDGQRHWPRDVDVAAFLGGCVKSIASHDRKKADARNAPLDSLFEREDGFGPIQHEAVPSAEEIAIQRQRRAMSEDAVDFARALLEQDFDGMRVLNGMVADLSPKDMKQAFGMDDKTYIAARQRVVNRLKIWAQRHPDY